MSHSGTPDHTPSSLSRRALLGTALAGASLAGTAIGATAATALTRAEPAVPTEHGTETIPCHGTHQAGIATAVTPYGRYLAFTLRDGVDRDAIRRMLRVVTQDIEALTRGVSPIADTEPELAHVPARLTVTVGFGRELVQRVAPMAIPEWLQPVRAFPRDQLDAGFSGGDLLLAIAADDQVTIAHASRMLAKTMRGFAQLAWRQDGFRRARASAPDGQTMRNLMGQVDGTTNPSPKDPDFPDLVWLGQDAGWMEHGTVQVFRRIRMEMDSWDQVDRVAREGAIGRDLAVGAPLTGRLEHEEPDWSATDGLGFPIIADYAHIRRAKSEDPNERIYRRVMNYDEDDEQGLLFICYQKDPRTQFEPIQARLDTLDLMNQWITHIGSAVFAISPGWEPGEMIGGSLFQVGV
ncbi:MAG: Dyp-type peroxidase [Canibacter sp.]